MKQTESKKASLFSEATPPGESQRFIKNSRYFTICVYGVVMLLITAIIFKAIIDFDKTKAWFGQVLGMLSPFFFGALLAYVLNPLVHTFYKFLGFLQKGKNKAAAWTSHHSVHPDYVPDHLRMPGFNSPVRSSGNRKKLYGFRKLYSHCVRYADESAGRTAGALSGSGF